MQKAIQTFIKLICLLCICWASQSVSALVVVDGVFQESGFDSPLDVDFKIGSNNISFATDTVNFGPDLIKFTVEENQTLDAAVLLNYTTIGGSPDSKGFFGLFNADQYNPSVIFTDTMNSGIFAGMLFGAGEVGSDLFDKEVNPANGMADFNLPINQLTAGEYIFWFNETSALDIYSIDFQLSGEPDAVDVGAVPLPAAAYLLLVPLAGVLGFRRKASV